MVRILFLAANPLDTDHLRIDEEFRAVDRAVRSAEYRDSFQILSGSAARFEDVRELFLHHQPDVVHFSGHGSSSGEILLQSDHDRSEPISIELLGRLFGVLADNICCVVLNACFSDEQATVIADHVDCVIGMANAVDDEAAIAFSTAFYQAMAFGRSVGEAFDLACIQMEFTEPSHVGNPQLICLRDDPANIVPVNATDDASANEASSVVLRGHRPQIPTTPESPFIGPIPFSDQQTSLFFGRQQQIDEIVHMTVEASALPLLVINGLSGSGKTSLLRAGVLPQLNALGYLVVYCSILDSPQSDLVRAVTHHYLAGAQTVPPQNALEALDSLQSASDLPVVLIIDQVERSFTLSRSNDERMGFWRDIAHLIQGESWRPVKLLLSVRSDWLYAFQSVSPASLGLPIFNPLYFLNPLDRESSRQALFGPFGLFHVECEPDVIDRIIEDLASEEGEINPPQLQVVGEAIYEYLNRERTNPEQPLRFSIEDYTALRGVNNILRQHLIRIVGVLGPNEQLTWQLLIRLVGRGDIRISVHEDVLRGNLSEAEFKTIINHLIENALVVRDISSVDKKHVYSLTHDYLVTEIKERIEGNHELQALRMAHQYLDIGLEDWRLTQESGGSRLLPLERERYNYIWDHRDAFSSLETEASGYLMQSALYHGDVNFSYWLSLIPPTEQPAAFGSIVQYCLHERNSVRTTASSAVIEAFQSDALGDLDYPLNECFWRVYRDDDDTLGPQNSLLSILWAARDYADWDQKRAVTPAVLRIKLSERRREIVTWAAGALFAVLAIGLFVLLRVQLQGAWHDVPWLYGGNITAVALTPSLPGEIYIATVRGPNRGDGAAVLHKQPDGQWDVVAPSLSTRGIQDLVAVDTLQGVRLFASVTGRGIYRSDYAGDEWQVINRGLTSYDISALLANPDVPGALYAGAADYSGVFETIDGGEQWIDISGEALFGVSVSAMVYSRADGGALLAGSTDGRVFNRDQGDKWDAVAAFTGDGSITALAAEPLLGEFVYAGTSTGRIMLSNDGGNTTWIPMGSPPNVFRITSIAVSPGLPNQVFINGYGIGGSVVWQSDDFGASWQAVPDSNFTREHSWLLLHPDDPKTMYSYGPAGLFTTADAGRSWVYDDQALAPISPIRGLAISSIPGGASYIIVGGAIFSTLEEDRNKWVRGKNVPAITVRAVTTDPVDASVAYASAYLPNMWSVFVTQDNGRNWQLLDPPQDIPQRHLDDTGAFEIAYDGTRKVLYIGTNGCGVLRSDDLGATWNTFGRTNCDIELGAPKNVRALAITPGSLDSIFAVGDGSNVYVSSNGGISWVRQDLALSSEIERIVVDPIIPDRLYLIAGADGFWRSDDGGVKWYSNSEGLAGRSLVSIAATTEPEVLYVAAGSEVWRTDNGGDSWQSIQENLNVGFSSAIVFDSRSDELILTTYENGIHAYRPGRLFDIADR